MTNETVNENVVGKKVVRVEFDKSGYSLPSLYPDAVAEVRVVFEDGSALRFTSSDLIDDNSVDVEFVSASQPTS